MAALLLAFVLRCGYFHSMIIDDQVPVLVKAMRYMSPGVLVPLLLMGIQLCSILLNVEGETRQYTLFNRDAFSYHVHWSQASENLNPFKEPVLIDPDNDVVRIPNSFPNFIFAVTNSIFNPFVTYAIWCCAGILIIWWSLIAFSKAVGFAGNTAVIMALIHFCLKDLLSQIPPLSLNQAGFIFDIFSLVPVSILHVGPLQYPHDIFFYPVLTGLLAMTIVGIRNIKENKKISLKGLIFWTGLCLLLPFNYLYHWFHFGALLGMVLVTGMLLKWWGIRRILNYKAVLAALAIVLSVWLAVLWFQSAQLSNEAGKFFAYSNGLTESRFTMVSAGLVVRVVLWILVLLLIAKIKPETIVPSIYLLLCPLLTNMQLITGKNIQAGHWGFGSPNMFAWVLIIIMGITLVPYIKRTLWRIDSNNRWLFNVSLVILLGVFSARSYASWHQFLKASVMDSERVELIEFLNTIPTGVALVPEIWLETDVLIHSSQKSFLPRGQQSAISQKERMERLAQAALILGYSKQGFIDWLHIRAIRFFGVMYGISKGFSSTLFYDPKTKAGVLKFQSGGLPEWDMDVVDKYTASSEPGRWRLDYLVLFKEEAFPDPNCALDSKVLFENQTYMILEAPPFSEWRKTWCSNLPHPEKEYILDL